MNASPDSSALKQALAACRPHFVAAGIFSALLNFLYLTPTLYMLLVYSRVIPTSGLTTLVYVSLIALAALATLAFLDWLRSRLLVKTGGRLDRLLAGPVMSAVLERHDLSRLERSNAMRQFDVLRQSLAGGVALSAFDAPWAPIYILAAFLLNPAIGVLCAASAAGLLGLAWLNEVATRAPLQAVGEAASAAYVRYDQTSALAAEARALGMTHGLVRKQVLERSALIELQTRTSFVAVNYASLIRFSRLVLQSSVLGLGAYLAVKGQIAPAAVVAGSLLLSRALAPIELIVASWKSIVQARAAYGGLSRVFADHAAKAPHTNFPAPRGEVAVEGVTCMTGNGRAPALDNVSFTIPAGHFIGVIGPSGAGKSTLLRLIAGAALPQRGVVRIDGSDFREWEPARLARHIGYLPQDFALFSGSIRDNISRFDIFLGESAEVVDARAIAAAQAAGVHETILTLPNGYQTQVGLGECGLSAGQTQRIALARALYGEPRILVLDEPNAHLDPEAEFHLVKKLATLQASGTTILVAAHRGAILSGASRLLVMGAGRVEMFAGLADVAEAMRAKSGAVSADELHAKRA